MRLDHRPEVHAIELIAGENQNIIELRRFDVAEVLPHRVRRALIPVGVVQRLLSGQQFDESAIERIKGIGAANMAMQAHGVELRQHVNAVQAAVDAVGRRMSMSRYLPATGTAGFERNLVSG